MLDENKQKAKATYSIMSFTRSWKTILSPFYKCIISVINIRAHAGIIPADLREWQVAPLGRKRGMNEAMFIYSVSFIYGVFIFIYSVYLFSYSVSLHD